MKSRFCYSFVASSIHDPALVRRTSAEYEHILAQVGGLPEGGLDTESLFPVHFIVTGGTENLALARWAERLASNPKLPMILVAHPFSNSLPASLEILARVRRDGGSGRIIYLDGPRDAAGAEKLAEAVRMASVCAEMGRTRIGQIGAPSEWLVASSQGSDAVKGTWGCELVPIAMEELEERYRAMSDRLPDAQAERFVAAARYCREPAPAEMATAYRVYLALKTLVDEWKLDALTLRCFDIVSRERTSGCYALARLADEGTDSGCEGDIPSIVALRWLHLLTGKCAWMANPARIDLGKREILLAHCTVPTSSVDSYGLRSHFESGIGVGIQGEFRRGSVTLIRIGGKHLERLWTAEGEIIDSGDEEGLCRTQVRIRLDTATPEDILADPLGNHIVMVPGRFERIAAECRALISPIGF